MPKTKKIVKKIKSEKSKKDTQGRHFEVILEDIDSKMTLVLEGHSSLDKKIDGFEGKFVEFKEETNTKFKIVGEKFDKIDQRFDGVDQRLDKMDKRFNGIDQRFDGIDKKIEKISGDSDELRNDMVFVKYKLSSIENSLKQKVDIEQFERLEQRVIRLEGLAAKR